MKKHYGGTLISQIKQLQDRVFNKILKKRAYTNSMVNKGESYFLYGKMRNSP